ncbi:MAG: hypothetical protein J5966_05305 [Lachnospiraceae bacterium]|nr:hypothetical protein [Lachnospiraceae bacterium]
MGSLRLAVARDEAFCFYYNENFRELERAGFDMVFFSPLRAKGLPENIAGLYIGGGYPELHAGVLSGNNSLMVDINARIADGMPVIAECGGFMYLTSGIRDESGTEYPMCGVFDPVCIKKDRLVRFGYVEVFDSTGSWLDSGEGIRGHEFHYYDTSDRAASERAAGSGPCGVEARIVKASGGAEYGGIYISGSIWAGWPHLYFRSRPAYAESFFRKCSSYRRIM